MSFLEARVATAIRRHREAASSCHAKLNEIDWWCQSARDRTQRSWQSFPDGMYVTNADSMQRFSRHSGVAIPAGAIGIDGHTTRSPDTERVARRILRLEARCGRVVGRGDRLADHIGRFDGAAGEEVAAIEWRPAAGRRWGTLCPTDVTADPCHLEGCYAARSCHPRRDHRHCHRDPPRRYRGR